MGISEKDLYIIFGCVGGVLLVALVLVVVLYCRRARAHRRQQEQEQHHQQSQVYRSLDDDNNRGRQRSRFTQDSVGNQTGASGGGDLADYLQNLVDGMERGRAERVGGVQSSYRADAKPAGGDKDKSKQHPKQPPQHSPYRGGDTSLITMVPSDASNVAQVPSTSAAQFSAYQRGSALFGGCDGFSPSGTGAIPPLIPLGFEPGEPLNDEKSRGIQMWREQVYQESDHLDDPTVPFITTPREERSGS